MTDTPYTPTADWGDTEWGVFSTWIRSILQSNEVKVTFTKKDGTERVMRCTLDPQVLPPLVPLAEGHEPRKESTTALRVFDLDKQEWRSFTYKSVKHITFSFGE